MIQKNLKIGRIVNNRHGAREQIDILNSKKEVTINFYDLAGRIYKDVKDISLEADKKRAQKLRKIKERYKRQIEY